MLLHTWDMDHLFELGRRAEHLTLTRSESAMSKATCHQAGALRFSLFTAPQVESVLVYSSKPGLMSCFRYGTIEEIKEKRGRFPPLKNKERPLLTISSVHYD